MNNEGLTPPLFDVQRIKKESRGVCPDKIAQRGRVVSEQTQDNFKIPAKMMSILDADERRLRRDGSTGSP